MQKMQIGQIIIRGTFSLKKGAEPQKNGQLFIPPQIRRFRNSPYAFLCAICVSAVKFLFG
jgi:hypothetical protein